MYDLIIVEDEPVVRRGLSQYPWAKWNLHLAGAFSGVQETLGWLHRHRADLMITDVRMTDGDGLALCDRVRVLQTNVVTVVLSAYSEFELARHAIDVGVFAYLIKPLDDDEMDGVLRRAIHYIDDCHRKDTALRHLNEQTVLRDLVLGRGADTESLNLELPLVVAVVKASPVRWQHFADCYPEWVRWSAPIDQAHTVVMVSVKDMATLHAGLVAEQLPSGWSGPVDSVDFLAQAFLEARRALERQGESPARRLDEVARNGHARRFPHGEWFAVMDELIQSAQTLSQGAWLEACSRLEQWSPKVSNLEILQPVVLELIYRIQRAVVGSDAGRVAAQDWQSIIATIEEARSLAEVTACLRGPLWELLERQERRHEAERVTLEQKRALAFITTHLGSDLSAQATAEHLGMSVSRFSRWFHDTMGRHYLEYVTDLRIERAKWLLANSDSPVHVVASEVGYTDPRYFKQVFRERIGLGPGAFRTSLGTRKVLP